MDVRSLVIRAVSCWPDREAIVAGDTRLTFAEAWSRGLRMANLLGELGLKPGDSVGVLEDNSVEASDFMLGCIAGNLVRVPLYARNSRESHRYMLERADCTALVVTSRYLAGVEGIEDEVESLRHVFVRDEGYEKVLADASDTDPAPIVSPDDLFLIRYTGGTTGMPKGLPFSHRQFIATERDWFYSFPAVELGDSTLHVAPISHGSGYLFLPSWIGGGRNVMLSKFESEVLLDAMESERIGYMFVVPTMLAEMARHPTAAGRDWSALKAINVAGAPSTESTLRLARDVFGDVLYQHYGQSEVIVGTMLTPREMVSTLPGSNPIQSVGRPLPWVGVRVLDVETKQELPLGEEGEVALQADGQVTEFWKDPETTAARIVDGWIMSGDIGRFDQNGYLYLCDRVDDMIISGGFNIYPRELENTIAGLPDVREVAVFGVPHEKWGETPAAVVVVDEGSELTPGEVIETCATGLGSYKKPTKVEITTEPLPKSPVGKVLRKALRASYWKDAERRVGSV